MVGYRVIFFDNQRLSYIDIDWISSNKSIQYIYQKLVYEGYDPDIVVISDVTGESYCGNYN